jgi:hypothetical protein
MPELLYIHPEVGFVYENIPMGVTGLMNSLNCSKFGVYDWEVKEEMIENAKIIAMDLHWYLGIPSFLKLVKKIRKINPSCKIVCGGITATVFSKTISNFVDYIVIGDAEKPFPMLVEAILEKKNISNIPNIVSKELSTGHKYFLTQEDYDNQNYIDIDWFPTIKKLMKKVHNMAYPFSFFPWISVFKGCIYSCERCYGNPCYSERVFKRGLVIRSPEKISYELDEYEKNGIKRVYIGHDFINILGIDYTKKILNRKRKIQIRYEFWNIPYLDCFEILIDSFDLVDVVINVIDIHGGGKGYIELKSFEELLRMGAKNARFFVFLGWRKDNDYVKELMKLKHKYRFYLLSKGEWYPSGIPDPFVNEEEEFKRVNKELIKDPFGRRYKWMAKGIRLISRSNYLLRLGLDLYD